MWSKAPCDNTGSPGCCAPDCLPATQAAALWAKNIFHHEILKETLKEHYTSSASSGRYGQQLQVFFLKIHFKNMQNSCSEFCMMLQLIKKKSGIPRKQTWHPVSRWLPLFSVLLRSGYPQRAPGGAVPSAERYGKMFQTPKPK